MKKITIVLAATLLGVCLSGCGKNTKQDNTETGIIEDVNASDEIETSEDLDVSNTEEKVNITSMTYEEASAYLDTLPKTDTSQFEITTDGMESGEAAISGYLGSDTIVIVPQEIDGYTITQINIWAFTNNEVIEVVKLPDTLKVIDESAFANCLALKYVFNLDNVEIVGESAFIYTNVTYFEFSDSVKEVENIWCDYFNKVITVKVPKGSVIETYALTTNDEFGKEVFVIEEK